MLFLAASLVAMFDTSGSRYSATDALVEFTRDFCLHERDRLHVAESEAPNGWKAAGRRERRNVDFSVDSPVPVHDQTEQIWTARYPSWYATLRVRRSDYHDPERNDYSSATLSISPSGEIDLNRFQRSSGIALRAGSGDDSPALSTSVVQRDGKLYVDGQPIRRPVQHFRNATDTAAGPEIRARHIVDDEFPEGLFSITCSTALRVALPVEPG